MIGLLQRIPKPRGRLALVSLIFALVAALATISALVVTQGGTEPTSEEDSHLSYSSASLQHSLLSCSLGIPTLRRRTLRSPWHLLPVALFGSFLPLMVVGGVLESINERLLEIPLLILGLGWALVGYGVIAARNPDTVQSPFRGELRRGRAMVIASRRLHQKETAA